MRCDLTSALPSVRDRQAELVLGDRSLQGCVIPRYNTLKIVTIK